MLQQISVMSVVLLLCSPAWAIKDPETGLVFPDGAKCDGKPAKAAGVGVREATFGIDVYGVVIYAGQKATGQSLRKSNGCVKIRARFVRDVGANKVYKAWAEGLQKHGMSKGDAGVKRMLSVIKADMKDKGEMIIETHGDKVRFQYMGTSTTIDDAAKLARAIKSLYLGERSPTPSLVKDVEKRKVARP